MAVRLLDKTFWKFVLVGVANTLVGTAVMFVFYNVFHFSYWVSSAANYIVGSVLSFFLNKYFTFRSQDATGKGIVRFAVNIALCYAVAYGGARPLVRWLCRGLSATWQDNLSMLVGMGLFVLLNYIGQRFFVFRKDK